MTELRVLIDTNIFIQTFRQKDSELQNMIADSDEAFINTVILFELLIGEPNKKRYAGMEDYLKQYSLLHLTPEICGGAVNLLRQFRFSNGLNFLDALIASTCLENDLYLFTLNRKDFSFIPDLKII